MKADPEIQQAWLRILREARRPGDVQCQKLGEGYYAVAHRPWSGNGTVSLGPATDYETLRTFIPHFDRTRAVPLSLSHLTAPSRSMTLKSWAGELAADVQAGVLHAFAVVDSEAFGETAALELRAAGWQVEGAKDELRVTEGRFVQRVNLLRVIVEMVIARSRIAEACRALREKVACEFTLYRKLFRGFAQRFQEFEPSVLDHYFTAYPGACCMSAGWDYWEVSGRTLSEAEQVFARAMEEFKSFLTTGSGKALASLLAGACQRETSERASPPVARAVRRRPGVSVDGFGPATPRNRARAHRRLR